MPNIEGLIKQMIAVPVEQISDFKTDEASCGKANDQGI